MSVPNILIVDDEPANYDVIERFLDEGYQLHYASCGIEALETLEEISIDLILLDIMMPELDGFEVCSRIKAHSAWRAIPILMITALSAKEDLARALSVGADDFLSKPVNSVELRARVLSLLRVKHYHDEIQRCHARELSLEQERQSLLQDRNSELEVQVRQRTASLQSAMAALSYNALHDPLTNLPNRRMLIEQLQLCLGEKAEGASSDYAVLFLDIDRFSNVNDSAGHLVGDHILAAVSKRILEEIKDEAQGFVSRFGGDEFVILFKGQPTVPLALALAGRILAAIESPIGLRDQDYVLSASIGIVHGSALYREANELLRDADLAMYQAKKAGGGCVRVFDEALRLRQIQRHELERDLRKALVQDELLPYYQPIIDLRQGRCIGFEALVRWRHPTHGLISPDAFIPIAEESGLLPRLTLQMLRRSAEQLADWLARFPESFPLKMNVNIGARDLAAGLLTEEVEKILQGSPLDGASFTIEVTETGLIENVNTALEVIEQLRSRGLQIAIDDFGTGYSSLAYLRKLPVTIVKIDRSFVSSMHLDDRCYTIVDSIIALGKRMGFQIVAEGIENTHQLRLLKLLGCDHGQGYFFSRPLPAEEVEQTLLLGATALPGPAAHP